MSDNEEVEGVTKFNPHDPEFSVPQEKDTTNLHTDMIKEEDTQPLSHEQEPQELPTAPLKPEDIPEDNAA